LKVSQSADLTDPPPFACLSRRRDPAPARDGWLEEKGLPTP